MMRITAIMLVLGILIAGCASQGAGQEKPASGQAVLANEASGGVKDDGMDSSMAVSEDGKSVTFGNGTGGSGTAESEGSVVSGGTLGMKKAEENETVESGSGGQVVDVGGSIPIR